jgi:hypothetical protein
MVKVTCVRERKANKKQSRQPKKVDPRLPVMLSRMPTTTSVVIKSRTAQSTLTTSSSSSSSSAVVSSKAVVTVNLSSTPPSSMVITEVKVAAAPKAPSLLQRIMERHIPYVARSPFVALAGVGDHFKTPVYIQ